MVGGPIHLIHLLDRFLVEEDRVAGLCVVLDMLLLFGVVPVAFMIVGVAGFVVEDVSLLRQVHHLTFGQVGSRIGCSKTVSLMDELSKASVMVRLRSHWVVS